MKILVPGSDGHCRSRCAEDSHEILLGATYDGMRRMDVVLGESDVQWTAIRAPRTLPSGEKRNYRLNIEGPMRHGWTITATDLTTALLDIAEHDDLSRKHMHVGK